MNRPRLSGYTLLELLVSVTMLSLVFGALFASFLALERTDGNQIRLTRMQNELHTALTTLTDSLSSARGSQKVEHTNNSGVRVCEVVQGYYRLGELGTVSLQQPQKSETATIVVLTSEIDHITGALVAVKREYSREVIRHSGGKTYGAIIEKTYRTSDTHTWPAPVDGCQGKQAWSLVPTSTRQLTTSELDVTQMSVRHTSFLPNEKLQQRLSSAPFVTLSLSAKSSTSTRAIGLQATVVPTYDYGVTHD